MVISNGFTSRYFHPTHFCPNPPSANTAPAKYHTLRHRHQGVARDIDEQYLYVVKWHTNINNRLQELEQVCNLVDENADEALGRSALARIGKAAAAQAQQQLCGLFRQLIDDILSVLHKVLVGLQGVSRCTHSCNEITSANGSWDM